MWCPSASTDHSDKIKTSNKSRGLIMAEVHAVKDLDTVRLISHLLERRYSKQMRYVWED